MSMATKEQAHVAPVELGGAPQQNAFTAELEAPNHAK